MKREFSKEELGKIKNKYPGMDLDLIYNFVSLLKRTFLIHNSLEQYFNLNSLSHGRFHLLAELIRTDDEGPVNPAELAERYGVKSATITGLIDTLERDGLVERVRNRHDRRKVDLTLTDKGRKKMDDFLPRYQTMVQSAFKDFNRTQQEELGQQMSRILQGIKEFTRLNHSSVEEPLPQGTFATANQED